ncbi:hypothetical protein JOM56_011703 [Amanita muscaria]
MHSIAEELETIYLYFTYDMPHRARKIYLPDICDRFFKCLDIKCDRYFLPKVSGPSSHMVVLIVKCLSTSLGTSVVVWRESIKILLIDEGGKQLMEGFSQYAKKVQREGELTVKEVPVYLKLMLCVNRRVVGHIRMLLVLDTSGLPKNPRSDAPRYVVWMTSRMSMIPGREGRKPFEAVPGMKVVAEVIPEWGESVVTLSDSRTKESRWMGVDEKNQRVHVYWPVSSVSETRGSLTVPAFSLPEPLNAVLLPPVDPIPSEQTHCTALKSVKTPPRDADTSWKCPQSTWFHLGKHGPSWPTCTSAESKESVKVEETDSGRLTWTPRIVLPCTKGRLGPVLDVACISQRS